MQGQEEYDDFTLLYKKNIYNYADKKDKHRWKAVLCFFFFFFFLPDLFFIEKKGIGSFYNKLCTVTGLNKTYKFFR